MNFKRGFLKGRNGYIGYNLMKIIKSENIQIWYNAWAQLQPRVDLCERCFNASPLFFIFALFFRSKKKWKKLKMFHLKRTLVKLWFCNSHNNNSLCRVRAITMYEIHIMIKLNISVFGFC